MTFAHATNGRHHLARCRRVNNWFSATSPPGCLVIVIKGQLPLKGSVVSWLPSTPSSVASYPPVIPLRCFFVYFTFVLHDLDYCSLAPHHGSVPCPMKIVNKDWLLLSLQLSTFISLFITYIQHLQVGSESFALPSDSHRINLHNFSSHAKPTSLDQLFYNEC